MRKEKQRLTPTDYEGSTVLERLKGEASHLFHHIASLGFVGFRPSPFSYRFDPAKSSERLTQDTLSKPRHFHNDCYTCVLPLGRVQLREVAVCAPQILKYFEIQLSLSREEQLYPSTVKHSSCYGRFYLRASHSCHLSIPPDDPAEVPAVRPLSPLLFGPYGPVPRVLPGPVNAGRAQPGHSGTCTGKTARPLRFAKTARERVLGSSFLDVASNFSKSEWTSRGRSPVRPH